MQRFVSKTTLGLLLALLASASTRGQGSVPESPPAAIFEQLSAQAASAREAGKVDDAIRLYHDALQLQPDWAEGLWYLGTLNYDANHYAEAVAALQSLVGLSPALTADMGPGLAFLGLSEFETKDYKNSLFHLQQAQQQGYGDDSQLAKVATYHLGLLLNRTGEFEKTADLLGPVVRASRPPDQIKVALGMALLRIPLLPEEVDPGNDALIHSAGEAAALLYGRDSHAAVEALRQLVDAYPKTPYLHNAYAAALAADGENEEALQETRAAAKGLAIATRPESNAAEIDESQRARYARNAIAENVSPLSTTAADPEGTFSTLTQQAAAAQAAGQTDAAITSLQKALGLRPEWGEGWRSLGTLYYASARYSDAILALRKSTSFDASNGNVWALLGLSEFETGDYKNSLIHLKRGRELGLAGNASAVRVARYHLAILLNRSGDFDRATELLTPEIGAGAAEDQVAFAFGMALLRIPLLPDKVDPADVPLVRLAGETAALLSASQYDQAFANFQQLLKMNPRTPYLHYAYGSALASASRYEEAEEQLVEEMKVTPGSALPFLRRSSIALQLRHPEDALQFAQRAAQLAPESAEAHYLLGRSFLELGKTVDAVKELETARNLVPNSPEVHFSLARAYAKAGQPDAAEKERAAFEPLNALVQSERSRTGSQAYGAIQNQNGIRAAEASGQQSQSNAPRP
jgi:tetratricopeptide (TPR) repeat protein